MTLFFADWKTIANLSIFLAPALIASITWKRFTDAVCNSTVLASTWFIAASKFSIWHANTWIAVFPNIHTKFISFIVNYAKTVLGFTFYFSRVFAYTSVATSWKSWSNFDSFSIVLTKTWFLCTVHVSIVVTGASVTLLFKCITDSIVSTLVHAFTWNWIFRAWDRSWF